MNILITGGAGYIGSITNRILRDSGHTTVIFDNLSNGHKDAVGDTPLIIGDLRNKVDIASVFKQNKFDAVIHFAALALAGESMEKPAQYFENNILGGVNLLEAMRIGSCKTIIFSSTCAVYGRPETVPVSENASIQPESVYGSSKRMFEEVLDWYDQLAGIKNIKLRYFNACGAMPDGTLGEAHTPETHIIPIALEVAAGKRDSFHIFGNDYETSDGTNIRDYIHVLDLADAHIKAIAYIQKTNISDVFNLGVGKGYSNNEVLNVIEKVTGKSMNRIYKERRPGDPAIIYADNAKALKLLGWNPVHSTLESIIESAWKWHQKNFDR